MDRRRFIGTMAGGLLAAPLAAEAQQGGKVARLGFLNYFSLESPVGRRVLDAFRQGLRERGYVEGQNLVIEYRHADDRFERLSALAAELARLKLDVIVTASTPAARALQKVTATIPIVASAMQDPVGDGLVASLARPGGNITGLTVLGPELVPKRLALMKEALPRALRVAALWQPGAFGEHTTRDMLRDTETTARALGVQVRFSDVQAPNDLDRAFSAITVEQPDALFVLSGPLLFNLRRRIVEFATTHRLPSVFVGRESVEAGGLISYGPSVDDLVRRAATYVDKILKGAKPGDLPVEQPTKFELVINLKTAKALGLTIPQSLLQRADQVIE
ncbi:MAG TPA: ABC transporter substrate-binding protein [Methylomirabilota bacterium]|nr:ABC transporter substrate-binding protein [Methylomirabilota bacterium]